MAAIINLASVLAFSSKYDISVGEGVYGCAQMLNSLHDEELRLHRPFETQARKTLVLGGVSVSAYDDNLYMSTIWGENNYTGLTVAGKALYAPVGDSSFGSTFEGHCDLTLGSPSVAYHYIRKIGVKQDDVLEAVFDFYMERIKVIRAQLDRLFYETAEGKKSFGRDINKEFAALGASRAMRDAWWGMAWKKEVTPAAFMDYVHRALGDPEKFSLALAAHSGKDLEDLGWKCRPSVPRTEAVLRAVSKATGIQPATDLEYRAWKALPGRWVFGA